jgi:hypothetical protein
MDPKSQGRSRNPAPTLEFLETRCLLSGGFRSIDGTGNNLANPDWGSAGTDLLRVAPASYGDGISTPAGADRPSARLISNVMADQTDDVINQRFMSDFVYVFGQFLDHDIDLTASDPSPSAAFNVPVPTGDPYFDPKGTGTQLIYFNRSVFDPATGTSTANPRQQPNLITAFIDGSQIYGSDDARADALRTHVGGLLKTSPGNLLPYNNTTYFATPLTNANDAHVLPNSQLFAAGDVRANENIELIAMQTLFVREHNRIATQIAAAHPNYSDEQLYQLARQQVIGELQAITYNEFLPALLGPGALKPYTGYKADVNPGVTTEFSTAAYRLGHSMLDDTIHRLDNNGQEIPAGSVPLQMAFFNTTYFDPNLPNHEGDIDPLLKAAMSGVAQDIDPLVVNAVRNFLFGPPGAGGFDLASLNIQRGRDHGLADYNTTRAAYGLPKVTSFADITKNVDLQQKLELLYGSVDKIDLWVGGLAEDHVPGASVGPTFYKIIVDQFQRLRDGDRYWFERIFRGKDLLQLENTHLSDIIRRNTSLTNVQDNVFFFKLTVSGQVYQDGSGKGRREGTGRGMAGVTVQLSDADGNLVATTVTDAWGRYQFTSLDGLELGTYRVRVVTPSGYVQTTADPADMTFTKGNVGQYGLNFGLAPQKKSGGDSGPGFHGRPGQNHSSLENFAFDPAWALLPGGIRDATRHDSENGR